MTGTETIKAMTTINRIITKQTNLLLSLQCLRSQFFFFFSFLLFFKKREKDEQRMGLKKGCLKEASYDEREKSICYMATNSCRKKAKQSTQFFTRRKCKHESFLELDRISDHNNGIEGGNRSTHLRKSKPRKKRERERERERDHTMKIVHQRKQ